MQHLRPTFFYYCWLTPPCPPYSLSPASVLGSMSSATTSVNSFRLESTLCWHDGIIQMLSTFLHWFSSHLFRYSFPDIIFMGFFLFVFLCADFNGFVVLCVHLRCNSELSAQPVCLKHKGCTCWAGASQPCQTDGVPISAQRRAVASPSPSWGGPALPAEPPGPQNHTGASMRKVTGACGWWGASSGPFCSYLCSFRTHLCSRFGLLMSTEVTVKPGKCLLCKASICCWHWWWVKKELVLTLGDPVPGVCGLDASCLWEWNSSTLKRINRKWSFSWKGSQLEWSELRFRQFDGNSLYFKLRSRRSGVYSFLETYIGISVTAHCSNIVLHMLSSSASHRYWINMSFIMQNIIFEVWNHYFVT